ncbi:MAG TPA: hypothetical protein VMT18_15520, partial [Planctomycetota bacterium]|nr:hypothetical protein [Planctomycetota bacterium]
MHDDRDPEPATQTPYVATILATLTLTVPVLLWAEVGVEERGRAGKVAARPDLSQEDPQEIARARTLVAQLEQGAEKRFLHARMARVTNRRPALSELLAGGDFDGERVR